MKLKHLMLPSMMLLTSFVPSAAVDGAEETIESLKSLFIKQITAYDKAYEKHVLYHKLLKKMKSEIGRPDNEGEEPHERERRRQLCFGMADQLMRQLPDVVEEEHNLWLAAHETASRANALQKSCESKNQ